MRKFDTELSAPYKYYKGLRIYTEQDRNREVEKVRKSFYQTKWNKWVISHCPRWVQRILLP